MNEKDKALAQEIVAKWKRDIGQVVKYERMESDIANALTTARKEAREAAFKEAEKAINVGFELRMGDSQNTQSLIDKFQKRALAALATTQKGDKNGK